MKNTLPHEIVHGASLRGKEYGWDLSAFPSAIKSAERLGFACSGGQFQFRLEDGRVCEMYWLNADPNDRERGEAWVHYSHRSCSEVLNGFLRLVNNTDFRKEATNWPDLETRMARGLDPMTLLVFVAYFVTEAEASVSSSLPNS